MIFERAILMIFLSGEGCLKLEPHTRVELIITKQTLRTFSVLFLCCLILLSFPPRTHPLFQPVSTVNTFLDALWVTNKVSPNLPVVKQDIRT